MQNPSQPIPSNWTARFFIIWGGQVVSLFGSSLVEFALVWYLTKQTGSATILATASLVAMLPHILLGPFTGALVDRGNRRIIMMVADSGIALATVLLACLFATEQVQIWHIYVVMAIRSLGGALHWASMSASTTLMVPEKYLTKISSMNDTLHGTIIIVAPPTGALLLEVLPIQGVFFIDISTAFLAILPLFFFNIPQPERDNEDSQTARKSSFLQDVGEGFTYIAAWPGLLIYLVMSTVTNFLLAPTYSLMPLLISEYFGLGALEFGLTDSASGLGVIAGGIILSFWGGFKRKIATSLMGIMGIGASIILVGLTPANAYYLVIICMTITGIMNPMANAPLLALVQSIVRPDMQGRIMSLIYSAVKAMSPLGLMVAGPVSDWLGIRTWFLIGGALSLLMGLAGFFIPAMMNVEDNNAYIRRHSPILTTPIESQKL